MDKYTKVKVLGKGSFGSATLIKRKADGQLFVVKEVSIARMSPKERDEARNEVKILAKLSHPNIVRYIEHIERRGTLFIVMEYADGGDLHQKIKAQRNTRMKESTVLHYFVQIALALDYLHSKHILHRDIKTMNVFLTSKGTVKLGDFGISTVLRNTMGMANTVCGTPYYFSPELCRNKPYNNKTDVWAVGVILYELAALKHPFDGNSMNQLMQCIVRSPYPPLPLSYSGEFRDLVRACLEKEHSKRPTIRAVLEFSVVQAAMQQLGSDLSAAREGQTRLQNVVADREDRQAKQQPVTPPKAPADFRPSPRPAMPDPRNDNNNAKGAREGMQPVNEFLKDLGKPIEQVLREREKQRAAMQDRAAEDLRRREAERRLKEREAQMERDRRLRGQAAAARVKKEEEERSKAEEARQRHLAELKRVMDEAEKRRKVQRRPERSPSPQAAGVAARVSPQRGGKPVELKPKSPPKPAVHKRPVPGAAYVEREERPAVSAQRQEQLREDARRRDEVARKAQNWVGREQQRKQREAQEQRREDQEAVRNIDRGPSAGQNRVPLDRELAAWVQQEGNKKDMLQSPKPLRRGEGRRHEGLRRSVDEADRVLRQIPTGRPHENIAAHPIGRVPQPAPRSATPPPSPLRHDFIQRDLRGAGDRRGSPAAANRQLDMDQSPALQRQPLWQRRENGGAEPQRLELDEHRGARPRALSHTRAPGVRDISAPPVMSPVRASAGISPSPGKEMVATATFQEVPERGGVDERLKRKQPDEFSDDDDEGDLEEDAVIEANLSNNEEDASAEYDQMQSHIETILTAKVPKMSPEVIQDESDACFGDDAPMSPGGGFVPEEEHVFHLGHLCGDHFKGRVPVFRDGRELVSSAGPHATAAVHAEVVRAYLSDAIGIKCLVNAYSRLCQVESAQDTSMEQDRIEAAREVIASGIGGRADDDDDLGRQEDVEQYLSFLCQLVYFDEELNRHQR